MLCAPAADAVVDSTSISASVECVATVTTSVSLASVGNQVLGAISVSLSVSLGCSSQILFFFFGQFGNNNHENNIIIENKLKKTSYKMYYLVSYAISKCLHDDIELLSLLSAYDIDC